MFIAKRLCLFAVVVLATISYFASTSGTFVEAEGSRSANVDPVIPNVGFPSLRHYANLTGQVVISVSATDDVGISRVELYLEGQLLASQDVNPNLPVVLLSFPWNTTGVSGKHLLSAKAYDAAGNVQTRSVVVMCKNYGSASPTPTPPTGNNITVDPATRYQTMTGWEATAQAGHLESAAWGNYRTAVFDGAVNDLGINRLRVEAPSGSENTIDYFAQWRAGLITQNEWMARRYDIANDNGDPNVINPNGFKWSELDNTIEQIVLPMRQRAQARGETLWINLCYVDFGSSSFEHKTNPAEYGEFVLAAYQHIQSRYGFVPDSWEVSLEPDTQSASWSSTQIAQAVKAAGDRLVLAGYTPSFVAPSTTSAAEAVTYIDQIAQTPGAMQFVAEFSYHRYCCATTDVLTNIANRAVQYNKRVAMLEWIGADADTLHQDLKLARNSSWQQFTLAFPNEPDNGAQYYLVNDAVPTLPIVGLGSRSKILRQYFKFIRRGAQRIRVMTGNNNFDPLAFINTDGKYVVVVKTTSGGSFNINGLPAGTYGLKYSTDLLYDVNLPDVSINAGQPVPTTIPTSGVITIYRR